MKSDLNCVIKKMSDADVKGYVDLECVIEGHMDPDGKTHHDARIVTGILRIRVKQLVAEKLPYGSNLYFVLAEKP